MAGGITDVYNATAGFDVANKIFHGLRLDMAQGQLYYDKADGTDGVPIKIPDPTSPGPNDYVIFFWTSDSISLSVSETGNLLMEYK